MAHDIFISYCHEDKTTADTACAILESEGLRCWIAPRDILPGSEWTESIMDGIGGAKALMLIFSRRADESPQVRREVERALHHAIPIVPVRIEDVMPGKAMEYLISTPHWLDALSPPVESHYRQLAASLKLLIGRSRREPVGAAPGANKLVSSTSARQTSRMPRIAAIAGLVAIALVAAVYLGIQRIHRPGGEAIAPAPETAQPSIPAPEVAIIAQPSSPTPTPAQIPAAQSASESYTPEQTLPPHPTQTIAPGSLPMVKVPVPRAIEPVPNHEASNPALVFMPAGAQRLSSSGSPDGQSPPAVFEDFSYATEQARFILVCPANTTMVRYAFDAGAFFDCNRFGRGNRDLEPATFLIWPVGSSLHLMLRDSSGVESGPFDYDVPSAREMAFSELKAEFLKVAAAPDAVHAYLIPFQWPMQDADLATANEQIREATNLSDKQQIMNAYQTQHRAFMNDSNALKAADCAFITSAPTVAVVGRRGVPAALWAVVKEVQIGTTPVAFPVVAQVKIDWNQFLKQGRFYFRNPPGVYGNPQQPFVAKPDQVWNAVMPADATSIVVRFVFQDGTVSDAFSYDVDTTRFRQ